MENNNSKNCKLVDQIILFIIISYFLGIEILRVIVTDADDGDSITYTIDSNEFAIRSLNEDGINYGIITTQSSYDRETREVYKLQVVASDFENKHKSKSILTF